MGEKPGRAVVELCVIALVVFFLGACAPKTAAQIAITVQPESNLTSVTPESDPTTEPTDAIVINQTPGSQPSVEPTRIKTQELVYRGSNEFSEIDGMEMTYIPAGVFSMGQTLKEKMEICLRDMDQFSCEISYFPNMEPVHIVYLNSFWMDKTEITNVMYQKCIAAGVCKMLDMNVPSLPEDYFANPKYANYPVQWVFWEQAQTYCQWAGRTLPTEAQWEKAARGVDARLYPWGNEQPTDKLANFNKTYNDENYVAVGSYPLGASPYGLLDMAGNVREWVADWYDETYYAISPIENPTGPDSGQSHILRGGFCHNISVDILAASRWAITERETPDEGNGFRCAINTSDITAPPPTLDRTLSLTNPLMQGDDVKLMQQRLIELGYTEAGTPDGIFGNMTKQAVCNFQIANDMVIDGIVGIKTWYRMFSEEAVRAKK